MIQQPCLFLGLYVNSSFSAKLALVTPEIQSLFIGPNYLQMLKKGDKVYIGKYIQKTSDIPTLELLEENVYSLLNKLVPDYPYKDHPLVLFPVEAPEKG